MTGICVFILIFNCFSKGGKDGASVTCKTCKGRGVQVVIRQLGPGMIQQMQTHCNDCAGQGTVMSDKDKCTTCKGAKTTKEKKTLEVQVPRGSVHGDKITFHGEADEAV